MGSVVWFFIFVLLLLLFIACHKTLVKVCCLDNTHKVPGSISKDKIMLQPVYNENTSNKSALPLYSTERIEDRKIESQEKDECEWPEDQCCRKHSEAGM